MGPALTVVVSQLLYDAVLGQTPTARRTPRMFDYANFLLGYQAEMGLASPTVSQLRSWGWSGYLQDDWKANRRLSVNLGLRYEFDTPIYEANNQLANFNPATQSIVRGQLQQSLHHQSQYQGLWAAPWRSLQPTTRLCFAAVSASAIRTGTASAPTTSA